MKTTLQFHIDSWERVPGIAYAVNTESHFNIDSKNDAADAPTLLRHFIAKHFQVAYNKDITITIGKDGDAHKRYRLRMDYDAHAMALVEMDYMEEQHCFETARTHFLRGEESDAIEQAVTIIKLGEVYTQEFA